jgi:hypothetical protein
MTIAALICGSRSPVPTIAADINLNSMMRQ